MAISQGSTQTSVVDQTTGAKAGVTGDRLKVDATFTTLPTVSTGVPGSKIRLDDMNVANGGVARDTAITSTVNYTTLYNYTGSGQLFSFAITLEGNLVGADPFNIKLEIDNVVVFELNTLDIGTTSLYNLNIAGAENTMGISVAENTFRYSSPRTGLIYNTSVKVSIKKAAGGSKRFRAGVLHLTKDT